jgi:D-glycero-D-manno-heptose 1,7-bisphosphate phosphatase
VTNGAAVFLDRDGVLNHTIERDGRPGSPRSLAEFVLFNDVSAAVAALKESGFGVFVVTNQPDVARGLLPEPLLDAMMAELSRQVPEDDWRACRHDEGDGCACRKPRPGMLEELAALWGVALDRSYMVGDAWRDIGAGQAAGCRTILLRRDYNESVTADHETDTLSGAAAWILNGAANGQRTG